jgi:hypothetical protein
MKNQYSMQPINANVSIFSVNSLVKLIHEISDSLSDTIKTADINNNIIDK